MPPHVFLRTCLVAWGLWCASCGGIVDDSGPGEEPPPEGTEPETEPPLDEGYCEDEIGGRAARVVLTRSLEAEGAVALRVEKYDAHESIIATLLDSLDDGLIDTSWIIDWKYDDRGEWTEMRQDTDGDGGVDLVQKREFDDDGNLVLEWTDSDGDGAADTTVVHSYDDQGRVAMTVSTGVVAVTTTYEYDRSGWNLIWTDHSSDGQLDWMQREQILDEGRRVITETDSYADGVVDWRNETTFDEEGQLLESITDSNADGMPDSLITNRYTAAGGIEQQIYDDDADGDPDLTIIYYYDAEGRLSARDSIGPDGLVTGSADYVYDGELVTETHTAENTTPKSAWSITRGPEGPVSTWHDFTDDGEPDIWATYVDCP